METLESLCSKALADKDKHDQNLKIIRQSVQSYPDFPKIGVNFWDIFSILKEPSVSKALFECLHRRVLLHSPNVDVFVGLDSRGFLFATHLALLFNKPFVPIRKKGKLPGALHKVSYQLEYGEDTMEIQAGSIAEGQNVVVVDDLLATGGTLKAANDLIAICKGVVTLNLVCFEITELRGRDKVSSPVQSLLSL